MRKKYDKTTTRKSSLNQTTFYDVNSIALITGSLLEDICKCILYMYHKCQDQLDAEILEDLEKYHDKESLFLDENDSFDINGVFDPETDIKELLGIFESDLLLKGRVIEQYDISIQKFHNTYTKEIEEDHIKMNDNSQAPSHLRQRFSRNLESEPVPP